MKKCCRYIEEFKVSEIWHINITSLAAINSHLDCLKYAHENGCPWNIYTTSSAAYNGELECLKYTHENGCPWDLDTTSYAAYKGYLECLKYAHENGCPWNIQTTLYAAENGKLECLKYAIENGCLWNKNTTWFASMKGHFKCIKYSIKNVVPFNEQDALSDLEIHVSKIDLDDKCWRSFLFERDLTTHLTLKKLVDTKKEEIKRMQEETTLLFSHISKDITQYVLWTYF
jgi:hypothetical protein